MRGGPAVCIVTHEIVDLLRSLRSNAWLFMCGALGQFQKCSCKWRHVNAFPGFPLYRWKLPANSESRRFAVSMAARQANCSYLSNFALLRDFILAHCQRARHNRTIAFVTVGGGEMEVLFSH